MTRSSCPNCGAPVNLATDEDTGESIPLEVSGDPSDDAPRYAVVAVNPLRVKRVESREARGNFQADHRSQCRSILRSCAVS